MLKLVDMKGDIFYKILDFLEDEAMVMADFTVAVLSAGYGASMSKIDYEYEIRQRDRHTHQIARDKKRKLEKYISKLKREGFITETQGSVAISSKGRKRLETFREKKLFEKVNFKKEIGDKVIIVSYDIPVLFNRERNILRGLLKFLGFQMVHQSVWVGKVKLPMEFVLGLEKLKILDYVQVLEVTKRGTLKDLVNLSN